MTSPPPPPPTPPLKESDIPTFSTSINMNGTSSNLWTRGRAFDRQSYFKVLTNLQDLEAKLKKSRIPERELCKREKLKLDQAFDYLEKLVLDYLFSDEGRDNWEKFELLEEPGCTTKNERMCKAFEAYLEEHQEELRTREVHIDFRTWRRNETIEQKRQERDRHEAEEATKMSAKRLEEQLRATKATKAYCGVALL